MIEKERKFLFNYKTDIDLNSFDSVIIRQGYMMLNAVTKQQLRVRIVTPVWKGKLPHNDKSSIAFITYKSCINETDRNEYEYQISYLDAIELYENECAFKLEKNRISFYSAQYGCHIDIDTYTKGEKTLRVVECEFQDKLKQIPRYCDEEITGIREYSNIYIAEHGI